MGRAPEGYFDLFVAKRSYGTFPGAAVKPKYGRLHH